MRKIFIALFIMLFIAACEGVQSAKLRPVDAEMAADLPTEVALAWLQKVPATHPPYRNGALATPPPPCRYSEAGIENTNGEIKPFSQWYVHHPFVYTDTYEWKYFVQGRVELKSDSRLLKGCYAYFQYIYVAESDIPDTMKSIRLDVEKTLTALASLGVKVN